MDINYSDLTTAHKRIYRARKKLGDDTLIAFFRIMKEQPGIQAIVMINQELDQGSSLDEIFYTPNPYGGYYLAAKDLDEKTIELEFGYVAGGLAGDGNEYQIEFQDDGSFVIYPGFPKEF